MDRMTVPLTRGQYAHLPSVSRISRKPGPPDASPSEYAGVARMLGRDHRMKTPASCSTDTTQMNLPVNPVFWGRTHVPPSFGLTGGIGFVQITYRMKGNRMTDEAELRFLDGPKLVEWLMSEGVEYRLLTDAQQRRWSDWKRGCRADLYSNTVDRIMTDNYLSSRLIPDDCWSEDQLNKNAGKKPRPATEMKRLKAEARLLLAAGCSITEVRTKVNVSERTVRKWRREMVEGDAELVAA